MADYNFDEVKRKEKEKIEKKISGDWPKSIQIGKEEKFETLEIDISDNLFLKVAKEAHARDITFNDMVLSIIKDGLKNAEYRANLKRRLNLIPSRKWSCEPPSDEEIEKFNMFNEDEPFGNRIIIPAT